MANSIWPAGAGERLLLVVAVSALVVAGVLLGTGRSGFWAMLVCLSATFILSLKRYRAEEAGRDREAETQDPREE